MARLLLLAAVFLSLLASCRGDDAQPDEGASDEEYLAVFCSGLDRYSDSLLAAASPAQIAGVVRDYIASIKAVTPPRDLQAFHASFITYLEGGLAEPSTLLSVPAPRPPTKVAERLARAESSVPECQDATYFGRK